MPEKISSRSRKDANDANDGQVLRMRAGRLALVAGIVIFAAKFVAYLITGSTAVLADAMESTVNVVSAGMLVLALSIAGRPPDEDHPYGHGKVEFLSAAVEGAAIAFAALIIFAEGIRSLLAGSELRSLDLGLAVLGASAVANLLLGRYLTSVGQRVNSVALKADGRHVLADVWTSVGVIAGLFLVHLTGWSWADPLIAMAVALNVAREGFQLINESLRSLMDEADPAVIEEAAGQLEQARKPTWIDLHGLRSWSSGARRHFDLHVSVPRYFDVAQIHEIHDDIEKALLGNDPEAGDAVIHFDACELHMCRACTVAPCPVRAADFIEQIPFSADSVIRTDDVLERTVK
jgi:cation diffusion facilitator family transporter